MNKQIEKTIGSVVAILPMVAFGQISNGGFESGDLTDWILRAGAVEVIQSAHFDNPIVPPEGSYYVLLSTTPDREAGVDSGADRDNFEGNEIDAAILNQTFNVVDVPAELSFSVAMLTGEGTADTSADIFECLLDGVSLVQGASSNASASSFGFAGPFDGASRRVTSSGSVNGSFFLEGVTAFQTVSTTISVGGSHTLSCFVGDGFGDGDVDSGLLLDNVVLTSRQPVAARSIPTVSTWGLLIMSTLLGLIGGVLRRRNT